ncbi:MAG: ABC transporter permease [Pseudomonadota bacterium]
MTVLLPTPPRPRAVGSINWIGLKTLYVKEVSRFLKVFTQTVAAPVVTTLLFYTIFALALGGLVRDADGVPFLEFLAPGLIMMALIQNSFANTSSSMVISKIQGNIVDVLMPPLSPVELLCGYVGGGITRGILVGAVTFAAIRVFVPVGLHDFFFIAYHAVAASMMLSLLGIIGGIWADKFDQMAAVTNFVIVPLSFLSGTFYTISRLPEVWQVIAHFNPFFYMIDGFRYGFIGQSDGTLVLGLFVMFGINLFLAIVAWRMLTTGYKLKP